MPVPIPHFPSQLHYEGEGHLEGHGSGGARFGGAAGVLAAAGGSIVDAFEPRIRELLAVYPTMPATVIAERIGWIRGLTVLRERIGELRAVYLPPDPASRTGYEPGEIRIQGRFRSCPAGRAAISQLAAPIMHLLNPRHDLLTPPP